MTTKPTAAAGLALTPAMWAAINEARGLMFRALDAKFPSKGGGLYAVACAGGLCDLLKSPAGAALAELIEGELAGTPFALVARRAN